MDAIREALLAEGPLTCEGLQAAINVVFAEDGRDRARSRRSSRTARRRPSATSRAHGPIARGRAVVVDLFPQDPASGCFSDMTRTFCVGEAPDELVATTRSCARRSTASCALIRPGIAGSELHRVVCELFEEARLPDAAHEGARRGARGGLLPQLGHGVGLEVHELADASGRIGEELVAGDVLAVEPGLYRIGFGGCRLEDLVLVTEDGCEVLTDFPYDLAP